ncbi:MAG TPA: NADH-quinone oxidoreductase subunit J [Abditibacteriaceae bacterium]
MNGDSIVFGLASLLVIASALMVVLNRHPVYSALFLVLTFVGLAVFFLQLQAPFLAAVQVIVYAGAIMVLFVFVIMLLGEDKPIRSESSGGSQLPLAIVFGLVTIVMLGFMMSNPAGINTVPGQPQMVKTLISDDIKDNPATVANEREAAVEAATVKFGSVQAIGNTLFTDYLFAFEATSVVLLIAMVGVVVLAKKRL